MLRSITFIRLIHTAIFVIMSGVLAIFLYEVTVDRISAFSWIALALFSVEGIILMIFGWRCPLIVYAEALGSSHGQVTDIFLPSWLADRIFHIYGGLFAFAAIILMIRIIR